jgi:prepilin-type N-terminal cleavage/methylation domain-containing protein
MLTKTRGELKNIGGFTLIELLVVIAISGGGYSTNPESGLANTIDLRWLAGHTSANNNPEEGYGFTLVPDF